MLVEYLHQLGKISQRSGQPVDLVDHDDVDLAAPDVGKELLQVWAVEGSTGEGAIVIAVGDQAPALVGLTLYICLAGLPLGIERVELEIEVMLGRLARVDRASEHLLWGAIHAKTSLIRSLGRPRDGPTRPACFGLAVGSSG